MVSMSPFSPSQLLQIHAHACMRVSESRTVLSLKNTDELSTRDVFDSINGIRINGNVDSSSVSHDDAVEEANDNSSIDTVNGDSNHSEQAEQAAAAKDVLQWIDATILHHNHHDWSNSTAPTMSIVANLTHEIVDTLEHLPKKVATDLSAQLQDVTHKIVLAQETELERQITELDRRFRQPLQDLAFSDVPLLEGKRTGGTNEDGNGTQQDGLVSGEKFSLDETRHMRTRDILRTFHVAPLYYSMALMVRWARKATSYPPMYLLSLYRSLASVIKSNSKGTTTKTYDTSGRVYGDNIQAGWKRTGEIASKGPIAKRWAVLRRSAEIWAYFSSFYIKDRRITSNFNSGKWSEKRFKQERSKLGKEITNNLLKLGPTFIKVGQLFSTRIDIVPREYIEELKELQDNVPGFSGEVAVRIIESELGKPIDELFDSFNRTVLAAASLGQVHLARKGDTIMAIKIQRQHLRELFEVDLGQLRQVAVFADALDLQAEGGLLDRNTRRDWVSVFEENKRLLYEEIDYLHELGNAQRFKKNFDSPKFRHIRIPSVYPEFTTEKVLAMEYVPGIKVTNKEAIVAAGLDPVAISVQMAESFLEQLCRHGFVSACVLLFAFLTFLCSELTMFMFPSSIPTLTPAMLPWKELQMEALGSSFMTLA